MARKQSNTVDYFPHEANPGKTIFILESRWGNDGYAFWFKLLSLLCQEEGHYLNCSKKQSWEYLLARTRVNEITGSEIMAMLANLGNIDTELWGSHKIVWCSRLVDNLKDVYSRRGRPLPRRPLPNTLPQESLSGVISEPEIEQGLISNDKNHQSKVNETKRNNKKAENIFSLPDWINKETWDAFLEMRGKLKSPPTPKAKELLIKKLDKLKEAGDDPNEILNQSIMNGWKGVFALKEHSGKVVRNTRQNPAVYEDPDEFFGRKTG